MFIHVANISAADNWQVFEVVNVRKISISGQNANELRSKCPQQQYQRTKGKRIKLQMSAAAEAADKR
ncbi:MULTISPECIES: hypothetical protein [Bacillaceae]|uniref:CSD domain-containing protein n=1 Tax=Evansella alkalicola TaxID=745819 RepID=A0ABS6K0G3_9BACI|nr:MULTISPECIES: hypothetical protein [Bacillaceae]MBU9724339.1 hypothetical protein [Bacillus alkalicola]